MTIVDVATRLFDEQGYNETTLVQIADAAEIAPSTFFNYFSSKVDVVFGLIDAIVESARARILGRAARRARSGGDRGLGPRGSPGRRAALFGDSPACARDHPVGSRARRRGAASLRAPGGRVRRGLRDRSRGAGRRHAPARHGRDRPESHARCVERVVRAPRRRCRARPERALRDQGRLPRDGARLGAVAIESLPPPPEDA